MRMHGYSHHMEHFVTSPNSLFCLFSPSYMNDWSLPAEMLSNELDETLLLSESAPAVLFDLWFYNGVVSLRNLWSDKILMFLTFGIVSICLGHRK